MILYHYNNDLDTVKGSIPADIDTKLTNKLDITRANDDNYKLKPIIILPICSKLTTTVQPGNYNTLKFYNYTGSIIAVRHEQYVFKTGNLRSKEAEYLQTTGIPKSKYYLGGAIGADRGTVNNTYDGLEIISFGKDFIRLYNPTDKAITTQAGYTYNTSTNKSTHSPVLYGLFLRNDITFYNNYDD